MSKTTTGIIVSKSRSTGLLFSVSSLALLLGQAAYAQSAPALTPAAPPAPGADSGTVEAVVITGSRLQAAGFTAPTPVTVIGADQIATHATTSVFEVTRDIPSFQSNSGPTANSSGAQSAAKANLNLRGLGATRTLVLINGQRHVPDSQTNSFDTNLIPTSLIDRVDIVTGGASAAYGSDAVAGVVNFVLKNHLQGFQGTVQYGESQRGDNVEPSISLAGGFAFAGGKGHFIVGGDFTHNNGTGTELARDWGQLEPGIVPMLATRPAGLPAQIVANHVETAAYTADGLIPSGPLKGTAFNADGSIYQLPFNSVYIGSSTQIAPGMSPNYGSFINPDERLRAKYERSGFLTRVEYELAPDTTIYAQAGFGSLFTHGKSFGARVPLFSSYVIPNTNPFIPPALLAAMNAAKLTSIPYSASRHDDVGSIESHNRTDSYQYNSGLKGKIFGDWDWDVGGGMGVAKFVPKLTSTPRTADFYESAYVVKDASGNPVCGPVATNPYFNSQAPDVKALLLKDLDPNCVPYNVFGNNTAANAAALRYFDSASEQYNTFFEYTADANLAGEPFKLPAGPVSLATGVEWRRDTANVVGCPDCQRGALANQNYPTYTGAINVREAYAEVGVPVIKDMPFFDALDLNGAVRRTDYSTSGAVTTWKVGGTWDVSEFLRFRYTRSHDIRAPNINELFNPGSEGNPNVINKVTGVAAFIKSNTVGNPNLVPEVGDTSTIGVVFQPRWWEWAKGFRASVDLYDIKMKNIISTIAVQDVLDGYLLQHNQSYAPFVILDPNNPTGIGKVNSPEANLNAQKTNGMDIEVDYRVPLDLLHIPGGLVFRTLGTHVQHLKTITATTNIDSAGVSMPWWSWNSTFTYELGRVSTTIQARSYGKIKYSATLIGPDDPNYSPTLSNSINRNIWPALTYWTLSGSYKLIEKADGQSLQLFGVIDNVMDKSPPIIAISIGGTSYDLIGRTFKVGLRFKY